MKFEERLLKITERYSNLTQLLLNPASLGDSFPKLAKEYADLEEIVEIINKYNKAQQELSDSEEMLKDPSTEEDLKSLATEEIPILENHKLELLHQLKIALLPKDIDDEN